MLNKSEAVMRTSHGLKGPRLLNPPQIIVYMPNHYKVPHDSHPDEVGCEGATWGSIEPLVQPDNLC
jgi:hypothetical protein